jgi:hypothetical protein
MRETLNAMHQIVSQIQEQNTTLASIAQQGQKDSRALKTLSVLAVAYVPASLIAVCEHCCDYKPELTEYCRQYLVLALSNRCRTNLVEIQARHISRCLLSFGYLL